MIENPLVYGEHIDREDINRGVLYSGSYSKDRIFDVNESTLQASVLGLVTIFC